ncbi:hypothetical protein [Actinomadura sp. 6N118]|uniref:hypothetical protein n=1 Tax=Actinomadura sp. 6N118 TaxID=3375151 RepID=UPI00379DC688
MEFFAEGAADGRPHSLYGFSPGSAAAQARGQEIDRDREVRDHPARSAAALGSLGAAERPVHSNRNQDPDDQTDRSAEGDRGDDSGHGGCDAAGS